MKLMNKMDYLNHKKRTGEDDCAIINDMLKPFHIIKHDTELNKSGKKVAIWKKRQLWVDLEEGRQQGKNPLTRAIKFNITHYDSDKQRRQDFCFKFPNLEDVILLRKRLDDMIKDWKKYIIVMEEECDERITDDEVLFARFMDAKNMVKKDDNQN